MGRAEVAAPNGYERFVVGDTMVVALRDAVAGVREALRVCRTLHAWASTLPSATAHEGRATAWGARLPHGDTEVVVRHATHGGLLAPLTGDLFRSPSRAPWELTASLRLREAGVATPEVVAYLLYPAGLGFCRSDVATRRLPKGEDFPAAWRRASSEEHDDQLDAVAALLRDLHRVGAHHPDLNAKNVYLSRHGAGGADGAWRAYALDVDRVRFLAPNDALVGAGNSARLRRSLLKWRAREGLVIADSQVARLEHGGEA
jgi:3-deoxy-D-manno-octulosonic acid kinase